MMGLTAGLVQGVLFAKFLPGLVPKGKVMLELVKSGK
jgi:hypothetical protein